MVSKFYHRRWRVFWRTIFRTNVFRLPCKWQGPQVAVFRWTNALLTSSSVCLMFPVLRFMFAVEISTSRVYAVWNFAHHKKNIFNMRRRRCCCSNYLRLTANVVYKNDRVLTHYWTTLHRHTQMKIGGKYKHIFWMLKAFMTTRMTQDDFSIY